MGPRTVSLALRLMAEAVELDPAPSRAAVASDLRDVIGALEGGDSFGARVALFDTLKNTLGAMAYHFWSQYLDPASRRPKKNAPKRRRTEDPDKTRNTLAAIEKFVNVQLLVLGTLQLIARAYPTQVKAKATCWLRTVSANTPSEFVTRIALSKKLSSANCTASEKTG